ncbi:MULTISPECIES: iron efflux ABC transporter ATP-binding subunit FetA [Providencia]|uniref:Iron ABC transporter ATP-binding protein FetA n=1 Tax=Providencia rettgeri TaxID=587 RepID=A0AB35L4C6_PRORE|nr:MULTISPECIES: iron ABC transporter ATP-binding protein FetA [Providencia]AWS51349.1 iron ABC transporter ATP-binding protein FetA [Providencia rettgeri]EHZ7765835.1 iron ABC transporter ATP-binding protein FetA [Providencia rettgeri]EIJ7168977.1 iron ABC transporter ATP-binding protein FetA [Providencia rettgeri]EJD6045486.1 iron ABC transporter ATP-binding protein FetA [Providencia rettgeri]EJD6049555.1 iron ABC transporter ATP-binding protein FetA [Providencia rettgeri]
MEESNLLLQLNNIGYSIEEKTILDNVQINLQAGDFKLITGPSGCGKSTLLKIIASLISPTQGTIQFQGKDINTISPETYRQQVSYCTQTPTLFGQTVYDNLVFPYQIRKLPLNKEKVISDLHQFSLHESILDKGINELSGGEKQRISLIRNLQFLPQVLLLDEITSALDEENKIIVNEFIHHLTSDKKIGVLWVTHDQDEIAHTNEVITLPVHHNES